MKAIRWLRFGPPVACVYNPLEYAREPYDIYLERYGRGEGRVLLLGMNPGPFGMAQTGVPFGDVQSVRGWLGIEGKVSKPAKEHQRRPVLGFSCERREVSGARLWGFARDFFGTPERFFAQFLVLNYCPLVFVEASGRNLTPDKLKPAERAPLFVACDEALRRTVECLSPAIVVGVGNFAAARARAALLGSGVPVAGILHPSPASPSANGGWAEKVERQLRELGVELPTQRQRAKR